MVPLLKKQKQLVRNLAFIPVAALGTLIGFAIWEMTLQIFVIAAPLAFLTGIGLAILVCGVPKVTLPKVKVPKIPPKVKPWLWFPLTFALGAILYFLIGLGLTKSGIPANVEPYISIGAGFLLAGVLSFFLVGFPNLVRAPRELWQKIPPERRPLLFWPFSALFAFLFFVAIGYGISELSGSVAALRGALDQYIPLITLALAIPAGAGLAYLAVGFPKPKRALSTYVPRVKPAHKPAAFALTFFVAGFLFGFPLGYLLSVVAPALPTVLLFPIALVAGYAIALGVAALAWGTPAKWREEGVAFTLIPQNARGILFIPVALAVAAFVVFLVAAAGLELGYGILAGAPLGILAGLAASGGFHVLARRAETGALLPDVPEKMKPLVFLTTWLVLASLLYFALGFVGVLPPWNLVVGAVVGLLAGVILVEEPLFRQYREARRARRERKQALKALREERLGIRKEPKAPKPKREKPAKAAVAPVATPDGAAPAKGPKKGFRLPFGKGQK